VKLAVLARPLVALIAGQALGTAGVDFTLAAPVTQRLLVHAHVSSDLFEEHAGPHQLDRLA
jgi:hypothetical protein